MCLNFRSFIQSKYLTNRADYYGMAVEKKDTKYATGMTTNSTPILTSQLLQKTIHVINIQVPCVTPRQQHMYS